MKLKVESINFSFRLLDPKMSCPISSLFGGVHTHKVVPNFINAKGGTEV